MSKTTVSWSESGRPMRDETDTSELPEIIRISRLIDIAPAVMTRPLVDLAHRNLISASHEELSAHLTIFFEACWPERLSPSEALSLVSGSNVGVECGFRKLTPSDLWTRWGRPSHEAWLEEDSSRSRPKPLEIVSLPSWWGSRFELWSARVAPDLPSTFRRAIGWSVLSTLLGEHVLTPVGGARLSIALAGASTRVRDDTLRLGGTLTLSAQASALVSLSVLPARLTATEPDDATTLDALSERQASPDHSSDRTLALLVSEALDGLERAQAEAGVPLVVKSSDHALEAVTVFKTNLAAKLRTLAPDIVDDVLSGSALLVRTMGALVAVVEGSTVVSGLHQAIAIEAASESVQGLVRYLDSGRWLARQA